MEAEERKFRINQNVGISIRLVGMQRSLLAGTVLDIKYKFFYYKNSLPCSAVPIVEMQTKIQIPLGKDFHDLFNNHDLRLDFLRKSLINVLVNVKSADDKYNVRRNEFLGVRLSKVIFTLGFCTEAMRTDYAWFMNTEFQTIVLLPVDDILANEKNIFLCTALKVNTLDMLKENLTFNESGFVVYADVHKRKPKENIALVKQLNEMYLKNNQLHERSIKY